MSRQSPFPGLDPYLQRHWSDFRHSFIQYSRDALQNELPEGLLSRVEERVYLEGFEGRIRSIVPDAHVVEWRPTSPPTAAVNVGGVALAESRVFVLEDDETTEAFLEIREADGGQVVTIIELLSPANKAGGVGTTKYLEKQAQVMQSETSLVEIDLVRGGRRVLALGESSIPADWRNDALALVRKGYEGSRVELFRLPLRAPLSPIPIPLRRGERPVLLNLQAIHDECYRKGRYDRLNYADPLTPPLHAQDAAWAADLAAAHGGQAAR